MSEEEGGPGPEAQPVPEPAPVSAPEDRPGNVLCGVFLIGCGLCLLLVGGGCTGLLIFMMVGSSGSSGDGSMLIVSLALAGGGIFAIVQGIRMARGRRPSIFLQIGGRGRDLSPDMLRYALVRIVLTGEETMKITTALAATLALGLFAAAPAVAQDRHDQHMNGDRHDQNMQGDRHDEHMQGDRHDEHMHGNRHDMHWHGDRHGIWHGNHHSWHRHCSWMWRHHHHVRVCR
ncbi:MAG TPA: hypothetical protein VH331_17695 [Allosphingosinicella sp.]|jgi:hypothetical protein|nr:hypothetical protein [Allosphingosinicella sp.]